VRKLCIGLFLLLALGCAESARAQCSSYTQVTATVTDPNSVPYAGANLSVDLSSSGGAPTCTGSDGQQYPFTAHLQTVLDSTGSFALQLPPNSIISPGGSQWKFTVSIVVPPPVGRGNQTFTYSATIAGSSQSLSTALSALAPAILYGGGGGTPCITTADSVQFNNAGAFGCLPMTWDPVNLILSLGSNAGMLFDGHSDASGANGMMSDIPMFTESNGQPVIENPNFETGTYWPVAASAVVPGWSHGAGTTLSYDTTSPEEGSTSLIVTTTAGQVLSEAWAAPDMFWPVTVGDTYTASIWAHGDGTLVPRLAEEFCTTNGVTCTTYTATGTSSTSWQQLTLTNAAPSGRSNVSINIGPTSTASAGSTEFDALSITDVSHTIAPSGALSQYQLLEMVDGFHAQGFGPGIAGQVPTSQGTSAYVSMQSPGLLDGNGGTPVTTTPYTIQCDSSSTIIDRAHVVVFQSGAAAVTVPLSTATGCGGGMVFTAIDDGAGTLTFSRSGSDVFSLYNGVNNIDSATSFTIGNGQSATLNQGRAGVWEVRVNSANHCAAAGTAANPSVVSCGAGTSGFFSCATNASTGTCTVNTTAVTANSVIQVQPDSTLGTALSVTCNTSADTGVTAPRISARTAGTSFTITLGTFSTNPECFSYLVIN
jgi:hypothetical protein